MNFNNLEGVDYDSLVNESGGRVRPDKNKEFIVLIIIITISTICLGLSIYTFIDYSKQLKYDDGSFDPKNSFYGCMCDAGSSGTRVSVYRWPKGKKNTIPILTEVERKRKEPGIHQLNESKIEETMNELIDFCKNKISELSFNTKNLSEVSFYLKATAGMRSISKEEQNKKLDIIRNTIKKSKLQFLNDSWVKVIDGSEEGLFGWIDVNYLNKILFNNEKAGKQIEIPYGSIDLGGYSLEITFSTNETIKEHNINLNLSEVNYNLYSYSYQDYGQTRFYEILMEYIIKKHAEKHETSNNIENPCYLEGYKEKYKLKNINYTIEGKTNIALCQEYIKHIMNISSERPMNNIYQPKIPENIKFYGISGLYWIANFFELADNKYHSASEFLTAAEELCKKKWDEAINYYAISEKKDKERLKRYCALGYYVYYFLVDGFKIDKNKKILNFPRKIGKDEVGWTLGAMSYEIGLLPL